MACEFIKYKNSILVILKWSFYINRPYLYTNNISIYFDVIYSKTNQIASFSSSYHDHTAPVLKILNNDANY